VQSNPTSTLPLHKQLPLGIFSVLQGICGYQQDQLCQQEREKSTQSITPSSILLQTLHHLSMMRCYFQSSSFKHMLRLLPNTFLLILFKLCILGLEVWNITY